MNTKMERRKSPIRVSEVRNRKRLAPEYWKDVPPHGRFNHHPRTPKPRKPRTPKIPIPRVRTRIKTDQNYGKPITVYYLRTTPTFTIPCPSFKGSSFKTPLLTACKSYKHITTTVDGKKYEYNPVFHEHYVGYMDSWPVMTNLQGQNSVQFEHDNFDFLPVIRTFAHTFDLDSALDDFAAKAEESFITVVPQNFQLINIIIELIEVLEGNVKLLNSFKDKWLIAVKSYFKKLAELKSMGKGIGSYWLAWRFAIRPTLRDLSQILHSMDNCKKLLTFIREHNLKTFTRHYRTSRKLVNVPDGTFIEAPWRFADLSGSWNPQLGMPPMAGVELPGRFGLRTTDCTVQACATASVYFNVAMKYMNDTFTALGTIWSEMAGLYNPWAIAYEAIPYTWLLDWCLSEKEKLRRYKDFMTDRFNPFGLATIVSSCWSLKIDIRCEIVYKDRPYSVPRVCGYVKYTRYERLNGLPDFGSSPFRLPTSAYQSSILMALLQQRTTRR